MAECAPLGDCFVICDIHVLSCYDVVSSPAAHAGDETTYNVQSTSAFLGA